MRAVQHQRLANLSFGNHLFQRAIADVVRAHKADLHQTLAELHLGIHHATAAFGGHRQRFLAEYRLARGDSGQRELFMRRVP